MSDPVFPRCRHPFVESNIYREPRRDGFYERCRICKKERMKKVSARHNKREWWPEMPLLATVW